LATEAQRHREENISRKGAKRGRGLSHHRMQAVGPEYDSSSIILAFHQKTDEVIVSNAYLKLNGETCGNAPMDVFTRDPADGKYIANPYA
jgi:hypothetical protein